MRALTLFRVVICVTVWGVLSLGAHVAVAQTAADSQRSESVGPPFNDSAVEFWSGQDVVPTFDGWKRNDDGTFTLVFGYFNKNYREELVIPPGPNNNLSPGNADQGQPTLFVPRREKWIFQVKVPADFGDKELVWTLTSHGRTEKATGKLIRQLYITDRMIISKGNLSPGLDDPNQRPAITISPVADASVSRPLDLTALVADDGLPKPRVQKVVEGAQTNGVDRPINLTVKWIPYRGPAGVSFDAKGQTVLSSDPTSSFQSGLPFTRKSIQMLAKNGGAVTAQVHFTEPGTYVMVATADDSELTTSTTVTVDVAK